MTPEMLLFHSLTLKKVGDWPRAIEVWDSLAAIESREAYWANLELAKYFEHKAVDPSRALEYARRALEICPYSQIEKERLLKRIDRLHGKTKFPSTSTPKR